MVEHTKQHWHAMASVPDHYDPNLFRTLVRVEMQMHACHCVPFACRLRAVCVPRQIASFPQPQSLVAAQAAIAASWLDCFRLRQRPPKVAPEGLRRARMVSALGFAPVAPGFEQAVDLDHAGGPNLALVVDEYPDGACQIFEFADGLGS